MASRLGSRESTIVVAGAGPVGLLFAALLASRLKRAFVEVLVVDPRGPPAQPISGDLRVYALSRASQVLLGEVGAWQGPLAARACAYRRMVVWERSGDSTARSLEFDCADIGEPDLGHIVEDGALRGALLHALSAFSNVAIRFHTAVESFDAFEEGVSVNLDAGERVAASLLVAADGMDSPIRKMIGLGVLRRSYGQHALVTHVSSELGHQQTAWQRFLPGGPLALLPLADGRSSIVWSLPDAEARRLRSVTDAELLQAIEEASDGVLGALTAIDARAFFPLRAQHARKYCGERIVLAGDAAHAVHPLAGQGMNLGLLDAASLAAVVAGAITAQDDPGDLKVLQRYERQRKGDNVAMMLAFDALARAFRAPAWLAPMRGAALAGLDHVPLAKRALMAKALGLCALEASASDVRRS
jgi:2-octaprenylphenol hydroxylase